MSGDGWADDYDMPGQGPEFETWVQETYRDVVGDLYDPDSEPRGVNKEAVDEVGPARPHCDRGR